MELTHFDLVSPAPIYMDGVGGIKSPTLREIRDAGGETAYNNKLSAILVGKTTILETLADGLDEEILEKLNDFQLYEMVILIDSIRDMVLDALNFFLVESVYFDPKQSVFITYRPIDMRRPGEIVEFGRITSENFMEVRDVILRRNYTKAPQENAERRSKKMIEFEKKLEAGRRKSKKFRDEQKAMQLGNLVQKIASHTTMNILNVFDLTVYQLYDQFFEVNSQTQIDAATHRWCIWGQDDFDLTLWYKSINEH